MQAKVIAGLPYINLTKGRKKDIMYMKLIKKKMKIGGEKKYYFLVQHTGDGKNFSRNWRRKRYINLGQLNEGELTSLFRSLSRFIPQNFKNLEKEQCKQKILKLWKQQGKINEKEVRKLIGRVKLHKYFGGMAALYKELNIPIPKWGAKASNTDRALLESLIKALKVHGRLSKTIIVKSCIVQPSTYIKRFGSLPKAYQLIGYQREGK